MVKIPNFQPFHILTDSSHIYHFYLELSAILCNLLAPKVCIVSQYTHGAEQCNAVQYSMVQYSAVQCSVVQYNAVPCSTVQYSSVQLSTVRCSTVQVAVCSDVISDYLPCLQSSEINAVGLSFALYAVWSVYGTLCIKL